MELGALLFGTLYVILAARGSILCWPAGILASCLSFAVAANSNYRLDAFKELYYIGMGVYGWYAWSRPAQHGLDQALRPVTTRSPRFNAVLIAWGLAVSAVLGYYFSSIGSSLPYLDAGTTVFAFTTTWLVAQKVIENWLYWIVINSVGIYMYLRAEAPFFSLLLAVYTVVAVLGYMKWRTLLKDQRAAYRDEGTIDA